MYLLYRHIGLRPYTLFAASSPKQASKNLYAVQFSSSYIIIPLTRFFDLSDSMLNQRCTSSSVQLCQYTTRSLPNLQHALQGARVTHPSHTQLCIFRCIHALHPLTPLDFRAISSFSKSIGLDVGQRKPRALYASIHITSARATYTAATLLCVIPILASIRTRHFLLARIPEC